MATLNGLKSERANLYNKISANDEKVEELQAIMECVSFEQGRLLPHKRAMSAMYNNRTFWRGPRNQEYRVLLAEAIESLSHQYEALNEAVKKIIERMVEISKETRDMQDRVDQLTRKINSWKDD